MRLAPSVGMDMWELHLACVDLALTRPVSDDASDGDGGDGGAAGAGSHGSGELEASITAVISRHEIALLAHPDRLCYTLVSRVLPRLPHALPRLLEVFRLLERCQELPSPSIAPAAAAAATPASAATREQNREVLEALRVAVRSLHRLAPSVDVRRLLLVLCGRPLEPSADVGASSAVLSAGASSAVLSAGASSAVLSVVVDVASFQTVRTPRLESRVEGLGARLHSSARFHSFPKKSSV
jgi:hypothetical protein